MTHPRVGALFSLQMLLFTRGRDYSFDEVHEWLQTAGFIDISEHPLDPPLTSSLVIARKP